MAGHISCFPMPVVTPQPQETDEESPSSSKRRSYADVSLVQRTLAVLECANRLELITVQRISDECAIPPSSVVRILETLCAEGYFEHVSRRGGYSLTSKVKALSAGYHSKSLIVEVVKPAVDALTKEYLWPFAAATLEHNAMVVQYSSIPLSPLAHVRSTLHKRASLISRAHGLAYMAFCSSRERTLLLRLALERDFEEDKIVSTNYQWRKALRMTRKTGYASRLSRADPFTNSLAVPIVVEPGHVVATIGVTYFRRVVKRSQITVMADALRAEASSAADAIRRRM
ncbi:helix-turn-helix domain-containing protein [Mesorhizobium sp. B2-6-1]|uniref:IclR family transcriptional regulator domain-containing protein n=1 Tax=Mesorhizobium sp. B2-6-1 TaxID=2589916 RepID=UPI0011278C4D|nr:helix-turn-helix domain-containing protein [Mesorhizobium sp. B2-6-1]TPJ57495.1 helix-turn-helix domain-containing protein [Mesorhizobium sp. B2-6-1]